MTDRTHERIAQLLHALPPAPRGWVEAARELPRARALMDEIVARAEADAEYRAQVCANLEAALSHVGVEPAQPLVRGAPTSAQPPGGDARGAPGVEPPRDRGRRDRRAAHLAGRRHARVGLGRLDRRRRAGLHPRQRHRGRPPLGRRGRERGRRHGRRRRQTPIVDEDDGGRRLRPRHRVRGHHPLARPGRASCTRSASSAPRTPGAARRSSPGFGMRSSSAST